MKYDERLIRAARDAYCRKVAEMLEQGCKNIDELQLTAMQAALTALDASRIAWVAPYKPPIRWQLGGRLIPEIDELWERQRDACLAERKDG